jgi:hypothetical protein
MYAGVWNQINHLLHYSFALVLVLILAPAIMFRNDREDVLERLLSGAIRMVLFLIMIGYVLVSLRLFELLSIVTIVFLFASRGILFKSKGSNRDRLWSTLTTYFFDYFDGKFYIGALIKAWFANKITLLKRSWVHYWTDYSRVSTGFVLLFILAVTAYMRFYDAVVHAAPAMSDAYVTLSWMKYIDQRILFHDGIYPQGFHIFLDVLMKFSAIDALYVLKYSGPLISLMMVCGIYFTVSRLSGNRTAGLIAALIMGFLGEVLTGSAWERQSSTNSQEFAFVFIMPTLYFFYQYIRKNERKDRLTAAVGTTVIGLVHSLAFAFLWLGIAALFLAEVMLSQRNLSKRIRSFGAIGLISGIISVLPLGIGILAGKGLHSSSGEYLVATSRTVIPYPTLDWLDYTALGCILITFIQAIVVKRSNPDKLLALFSSLFGIGMFIVYYYGGPLTNSILISSRSGELWAITAPLCIGLGTMVLFRWLGSFSRKAVIELSICVALCMASIIYMPPQPILPYKMESDTTVEQYLKISSLNRPKSWMLIYSLKEGQTLVDGSGFHMYVGREDVATNLLRDYDPKKEHLTLFGKEKSSANIANDVYIFYEKKIFKVLETNSIYSLLKPEYDKREREMLQLRQWIDTHIEAGHKVDVFFDNEELTVYHLHREITKEQRQKTIWQ